MAAPWWREGIKKAVANPDYFWSVVFSWAQRAAVVLLPITSGSAWPWSTATGKRASSSTTTLIVAMDLLSFAFLTNAFGLILPAPVMGWYFGFLALWSPVNIFQTLRGAYGSSILGAILKTLIIWLVSATAFIALMVGLLVFSLTEL